MDEAGFSEWLTQRTDKAGVPLDAKIYSVGEVMNVLGVTLRAYQYWEAQSIYPDPGAKLGPESYPVPSPERRKLRHATSEARVYSWAQFMAIARWYWDWKKEVSGAE